MKEHISLLKIILINLILALPAFYYLFVLKIFFISSGVSENMLNFNYLNKFAVIFSIFFSYVTLTIFEKKSFMIFFEKKNYLVLLTTIIISFISLINFDYNFNNTGGGFFFTSISFNF